MRRALVLGILGLAGLVPSASATVEVRDSDTTALLDTYDRASCRSHKSGKVGFTAFSLPADASYTVDVFITKEVWRGFGHTYPMYYGAGGISVDVFGPGGALFGNDDSLPGTPPGTVGAGGVKISNNGKRFSVGAYGLPNDSFTAGVSVTGGGKCKYPKRR